MPVVADSVQDPRVGWDKAGIHIALVNNMPGVAREDTERQFLELLDAASANIQVRIKRFSLLDTQRNDHGRHRFEELYFTIDDLWANHFDALVVTGTEPRYADLRQEPYWPRLADVLDWAEENTSSSILSCLAAHASVLHSDNIVRQSLADKQFGVFKFRKVGHHPLTCGVENTLYFPHSRWNQVAETELSLCGYEVLTHSDDAGVDLFVKKKRNSLFVHFQGHPEYGALTLLKEYRRDVRRFLRGERETYPSMPLGYFDMGAVKQMTNFQTFARTHRSEELIANFPATLGATTLQNSWRSAATRIYRNWLYYLESRKSDTLSFAPTYGVGRIGPVTAQRKRD